ncbi:hypothetical protein SLE2022_259010 [Rubroshorea leprosula]
MASSPQKALAKQLREHLQEQQEPFTLDVYLPVRGNTMKCLSSHISINLFQNPERPRSHELFLHSPTIELVLFQFISANPTQENCLSYCSKPQKDEISES